MAKKKLLIFSDCFTYSGSENVIENIRLSQKINLEFDVYFVYGYNSSYQARLEERSAYLGLSNENVSPIYLLSPDWAINKYNLSGISLKKAALFIRVIFLKVFKLLFISHLYNFLSLKRRLKKISPDVLYINNGGYPASLQCCVAVFAASAIKLNNIYFNINNLATPINKFYEKRLDAYINRHVTKFITASFAAGEHALHNRLLQAGKFIRIPNTINNEAFLAEKYGSEKGLNPVLTFGSVGLLTNRKGYHILLEAARILVHEQNVTDFKIKLIGDGEDRPLLQELCEKYDIENYVAFLGFKPNPLDELSDFDVFVLPSIKNEDFPYVILEAMILAKPVIGTKIAGIPEQVSNSASGFLIEPNNASDLANAMVKFLSDKAVINEMGLKGRKKYMNEFRYSIIEDLYFKLFTSSN